MSDSLEKRGFKYFDNVNAVRCDEYTLRSKMSKVFVDVEPQFARVANGSKVECGEYVFVKMTEDEIKEANKEEAAKEA